MSDGNFANFTGNNLEKAVQSIFYEHNFEIVEHKDWIKNKSNFGEDILIRNVPYKTIYNHKGKMEFLVISKKYNLNVRIECKWQQVSGSVDEKFPYLYLNCIEKIEEKEFIIIVGGKGQKEGAINWLKNAVKNKLYTDETNKDKNIQIFDLDDFMKWANKKFK